MIVRTFGKIEIQSGVGKRKVSVPRFDSFSTSSIQSKVHSRILAKGTKAEVSLGKKLWALGIRYRKNYKKLPGKPDFVLTKIKTVVFVDGDFWHGRDWDNRKERIKTNIEYWIPKISRNIQRDIEVNNQLIALGWKVIRVWESDALKETDQCVLEIRNLLLES